MNEYALSVHRIEDNALLRRVKCYCWPWCNQTFHGVGEGMTGGKGLKWRGQAVMTLSQWSAPLVDS